MGEEMCLACYIDLAIEALEMSRLWWPARPKIHVPNSELWKALNLVCVRRLWVPKTNLGSSS